MTKEKMSPLESFQRGLLSRDEYCGYIKGNIIECVVNCEKKEDPIEYIDKAMCYLYELYYLIGSEELGVSIAGFKDLSELTHARNELLK